jgi:hypothetical protein
LCLFPAGCSVFRPGPISVSFSPSFSPNCLVLPLPPPPLL